MNAQRVKEVFADALELPGGARAAFLDSACARDAGLRAEVQSLLSAAESTDALLGAPLGGQDLAPLVPLREGPGAMVGNYRLVDATLCHMCSVFIPCRVLPHLPRETSHR